MGHWSKLKMAVDARRRRRPELTPVSLSEEDQQAALSRLRGATVNHLLTEDILTLAWFSTAYAGQPLGEAADRATELKSLIPDEMVAPARRIRRDLGGGVG